MQCYALPYSQDTDSPDTNSCVCPNSRVVNALYKRDTYLYNLLLISECCQKLNLSRSRKLRVLMELNWAIP